MTTINRLTTADTVALVDRVVIWSEQDGDTRGATLQTLSALLGSGGGGGTTPTTPAGTTRVLVSPVFTPFTTTVAPATGDIWLILSPVPALSVGTVELPALASCVDGQEILISTTKPLTELTIDGGDADVTGDPGALAADGYIRLRFDAALVAWVRVG